MMQIFKRKDKKLTKQHSRSESADRGIPSKPVLGVPLQVAITNSKCYDGIPVPSLVRRCIDYVEDHGLDVEGIYRVSSSVSWLDEIERAANSGGNVVFNEAHDASGLLKRFLRQLPEHLLRYGPYLPSDFDNVADACSCASDQPCKCEVARKVKEMLSEAPKENLYLLAYIFIHSNHVITKQDSNKMTYSGLGVLLHACMSISTKMIRLLILNACPSSVTKASPSTTYLFDDIPFKRYAPPLTAEEIASSPPETAAALECEILKQRNLLQDVEDQVLEAQKLNQDATQKLHDMWEIQAVITTLNRKLKTLIHGARQEGDDEASTSTASEALGLCEPGPIMEKQLLAVQSSLIEEIADEQRQIHELTSRLHELQRDIKLNLAAQKTPPQDRSSLPYRPKIAPPPPPPQVPIFDPTVVNGIATDGILEKNLPTCNECHRQEARKEALVAAIAKVRDESAQLRAKLESSRGVPVDAADDFGNASVLVTKF